MLVYLLRNLKVFLVGLTRPGLHPLETSKLNLRVRITDLDYNLHMNNARYLEAFEMGRFDLMTKMGAAVVSFRDGLAPVVATAHVVYRTSLSPFQAYTVQTRVAGWDEKYFYIEQDMVSNGNKVVHATALMKATFLKKGKTLPPMDFLKAINVEAPLPLQIPEYILKLVEGETPQYEAMRSRRDAATLATSNNNHNNNAKKQVR